MAAVLNSPYKTPFSRSLRIADRYVGVDADLLKDLGVDDAENRRQRF
jgi:hypothetical protein